MSSTTVTRKATPPGGTSQNAGERACVHKRVAALSTWCVDFAPHHVLWYFWYVSLMYTPPKVRKAHDSQGTAATQVPTARRCAWGGARGAVHRSAGVRRHATPLAWPSARAASRASTAVWIQPPADGIRRPWNPNRRLTPSRARKGRRGLAGLRARHRSGRSWRMRCCRGRTPCVPATLPRPPAAPYSSSNSLRSPTPHRIPNNGARHTATAHRTHS